MNLNDRSLSLCPELFYKKAKNLQLRPQLMSLLGARGTECREKVNDYRLEIEAEILFLIQVTPPPLSGRKPL